MESNGKSDSINRYQQCINDVFDYVCHVCIMEGLSMEEALGVLTVVRGSLEINIAVHKAEARSRNEDDRLLEEDEDYDE
tara:strand:+ start:206 stop:442 length:237 start_codon:yes stop_codon:yes gene_type:complete